MAHIDLPRALEDYFAFAETTPTRHGRRFVLTLPYFIGGRLDRLQWWFHLSPEQERQMGETAIATLRTQATGRFCRHIERWLQNTRQRLHGDEPIPQISRLDESLPAPASIGATPVPPAPPSSSSPAAPADPASNEPALPAWRPDKVANG